MPQKKLRSIALIIALVLLAGNCRYRAEAGGFDLSAFRDDPELVSLSDSLKGIVPTNAEVIQAVEARDRGGDLRFVVIGDTVSKYNETFKAFLGEIAALDPKPAFIVHLGDRAVSPVIESFGAYLKAIQDPPCPILHVDGNHDLREEGERLARAFFGGRDFTFDLGDKRFVFMGDAGARWSHGFSREQLGWLERVLRRARSEAGVLLRPRPAAGPIQADRSRPGLAPHAGHRQRTGVPGHPRPPPRRHGRFRPPSRPRLARL